MAEWNWTREFPAWVDKALAEELEKLKSPAMTWDQTQQCRARVALLEQIRDLPKVDPQQGFYVEDREVGF